MLFASKRARSAARLGAVGAMLLVGALAVSGCTSSSAVAGAVAQVSIPDRELPAEVVTELTDAVTHAQEVAGASGAIVAVWVPWSGSWETGLGSASADDDEPVTTDMHFRAGNVTRMMTCDVLFAAAERDDVELDATVDSLVPGTHLDDVSLRQLCDGTSGLSSISAEVADRVLATPERRWNPRELASTASSQREEPGVEVTDSDGAYLLLGLALEQATGSSLSDLVARDVARPLGLSQTALPGSAAATAGEPLLRGYVATGDDDARCSDAHEISEMSASSGWANAGVTTTIEDLARYGQSVAMSSLDGDGQPIDRFARPLPFGDDSYVGGAYVAGGLIGQQGSYGGYLTSVYADPATGMTVAVTMNNSSASSDLVGALAHELAAIASKAPAAEGLERPTFGLTWTPADAREQVDAAGVCDPS